MSQGNLIKTSYSEITATIELFDRLGVTSEHLAVFRKSASWQQIAIAAAISGDPLLLGLLGLEIPMKKAGIKASDLLKFDEDMLRNIRNVLLGLSEIKPIPHVIDCDAPPFVPDGWTIEEHKKGGMFAWTPNAVALYLSKPQRKGNVISGYNLRKELEHKPVLNANVLDYLLKNPHLIPEEWKGKYVFFWGTIYRASAGDLFVRYLHWDGDRWRWSWDWLEDGWNDEGPAALRVSSSV